MLISNQLILAAVASGIAAAVIFANLWRVLLEVHLIWRCEPVELNVRRASAKRVFYGYIVEIEHELPLAGGAISSHRAGPEGTIRALTKKRSETYLAALGPTVKGYRDPKSNQTYCTMRHFDAIDKFFSPFLLLAVPMLGIGSLSLMILCIYALVSAN